MMKAACKFVGIIGGEAKTFVAGDAITKEEAQELGLSEKTELIEKGAKIAKPSKA